ncbi:MAG: aminotransferase class I/II-fold pyridoxal phosphate-dependent enzyme [Candidatus Gracilibacteria bacterium]|nr:aminotransferase class I/II-fold pyridoxal phosphate-dependent enzyme [Candidatus Gracilibacteria bacterium]
MLKNTIISEFFTTVNFTIFLQTIGFLTYKLPFIRYGNNVAELENELLSYIGNPNSKIISFYNARSAIYHALKIIDLKNTDEVIVSGYNCVSVSNVVIQSGAKIIYSDIDETNLGLCIDSLEKNITLNTKAIIVQHTFGKPANIKEIVALARNKNILIIEDCAHSLGSSIDGVKLGSFGDFSVFSTGRDKVISGVTGGFLIINNNRYIDKLEQVKSIQIMPSIILTFQNLLYNISAYKSYKLYDFFGLGKMIIYLSRKFKFITEILTVNEKKCSFTDFNYKLPNSLAYLAKKQLHKINDINNHRIALSDYYDKNINNKYFKPLFTIIKSENNNYFRYPIILESEEVKEELYIYMKKNNILLGNTWSKTNIVPYGTNLDDAKYIAGSCPVSEDISKRILNLPNHTLITIEDADKIIQLLNNFKNNV